MENLTENMKNWAADKEPVKDLEKEVEAILEQRRKDEAEHWANVPDVDVLEPKVPWGCKWVAVILALGFVAIGGLGLWKTLEIILQWI